MTTRLKKPLVTILVGAGLGTLVLGIGARLAMHLIARLTTGAGSFSLGGSVTVIALGTASGALAGLILVGARALFRRWPPATTVVYWMALLAIVLRGLNPLDQLRILVFIPLVIVFGIALQWSTWPGRPR